MAQQSLPQAERALRFCFRSHNAEKNIWNAAPDMDWAEMQVLSISQLRFGVMHRQLNQSIGALDCRSARLATGARRASCGCTSWAASTSRSSTTCSRASRTSTTRPSQRSSRFADAWSLVPLQVCLSWCASVRVPCHCRCRRRARSSGFRTTRTRPSASCTCRTCAHCATWAEDTRQRSCPRARPHPLQLAPALRVMASPPSHPAGTRPPREPSAPRTDPFLSSFSLFAAFRLLVLGVDGYGVSLVKLPNLLSRLDNATANSRGSSWEAAESRRAVEERLENAIPVQSNDRESKASMRLTNQ